jgi:alkaline phosphatase D
MTIDRRGLLGLIGGGAAVPALARAATRDAGARFEHGVASGDPGADSVVIWTRLSGVNNPHEVTWRLWPADGSAQPLTGQVTTAADRDFTVKTVVGGLEPGREYAFEFEAGGVTSPRGRTRTLPAGGVGEAVLAVVSCQLHPGGLFNAYDAIARLERLDAVVHLGDYIYEYGAETDAYGMRTGEALGRIPVPAHEITTLADYRARHGQYKADPDLQAAHARAPFICVWDDHEVANDSWLSGAENHTPATEGHYATRKAAALKAYFEWMPIRDPQPGAMAEAIQRSFHFGDLASLHMVETRLLARGQQLDYEVELPTGEVTEAAVAAFEAKRNDPSRTLLGEAQRRWLGEALTASRAAGRPWQIIGNQVVMAKVAGPDVTRLASPLERFVLMQRLPEAYRPMVARLIDLFRHGLPFNLDSWDGYPAERERLYGLFAEAGVEPIVLAGDSHAFWVNELHDNAGVRRAVEFGTSSISSPSPGDQLPSFPLGGALNATNAEVVFCDQSSKGFVLLTLTPEAATAELKAVSTILTRPYELTTVRTYRVARDGDGLGALEDLTPTAAEAAA